MDSSGESLRAKGSAALAVRDDFDEVLRECLFLSRGQRGLVFDRVGDATEQVGIAHDVTKWFGKLRYGESERSGNALQNFALIGEIAVLDRR